MTKNHVFTGKYTKRSYQSYIFFVLSILNLPKQMKKIVRTLNALNELKILFHLKLSNKRIPSSVYNFQWFIRFEETSTQSDEKKLNKIPKTTYIWLKHIEHHGYRENIGRMGGTIKGIQKFRGIFELYIDSWIIMSNFSTSKTFIWEKGGEQWVFGTTGIVGSIAAALLEGYIASAISHESS